MLSIANEVDSLIFRCVCFVCNTNYVFPIATWRFNICVGAVKGGLYARKKKKKNQGLCLC